VGGMGRYGTVKTLGTKGPPQHPPLPAHSAVPRTTAQGGDPREDNLPPRQSGPSLSVHPGRTSLYDQRTEIQTHHQTHHHHGGPTGEGKVGTLDRRCGPSSGAITSTAIATGSTNAATWTTPGTLSGCRCQECVEQGRAARDGAGTSVETRYARAGGPTGENEDWRLQQQQQQQQQQRYRQQPPPSRWPAAGQEPVYGEASVGPGYCAPCRKVSAPDLGPPASPGRCMDPSDWQRYGAGDNAFAPPPPDEGQRPMNATRYSSPRPGKTYQVGWGRPARRGDGSGNGGTSTGPPAPRAYHGGWEADELVTGGRYREGKEGRTRGRGGGGAEGKGVPEGYSIDGTYGMCKPCSDDEYMGDAHFAVAAGSWSYDRRPPPPQPYGEPVGGVPR